MASYVDRTRAPRTSSRYAPDGRPSIQTPNLSDYDSAGPSSRNADQALGPVYNITQEYGYRPTSNHRSEGPLLRPGESVLGTPYDPVLNPSYIQDDGAQSGEPYAGDPYDDVMTSVMDIINGGVRDTSADEALINDIYLGKMGAGMGDLAAQFGASGMGQSGALLGAGADLQGQLARAASQDILGVRQGARDEYVRNLMDAIGASQSERRLGMSEEEFGMVRAILDEMFTGGGGGGGGGGGPIDQIAGYVGQGIDAVTGFDYVGALMDMLSNQQDDGQDVTVEQNGEWVSGSDVDTSPPREVNSASDIPGYSDGSAELYESYGGYDYYVGSDGNRYMVATK